MLAVIVCNICTVAMLVGFLAGIVAGMVEARIAIADALFADPLIVTPGARPSRGDLRTPTPRWLPV